MRVPELVSVFGSQSLSESLIFFSGSTTSDSHILSPVIRAKALLFTLIRAFEIDLAVSTKDIGTKALNFQRPILLTDPNNSNQMPTCNTIPEVVCIFNGSNVCM